MSRYLREHPGADLEPRGTHATGVAIEPGPQSLLQRALVAMPRHRAGVLAAGGFPVYFLLAMAAFSQAWADPLHRQVGVSSDPQQFAWFMAWPGYALSHHLNPLVTTYIDAPSGVNLMWNTSVLLPAFLLSPVTWIAGPVLSYNIVLTVGIALSGSSAMLLFRRFAAPLPAFAGGALYAFSPFMMASSLAHPQIVLGFFPPLVLLLAEEALVRRRWPRWVTGALIGLLGFAQLLTGEEVFATGVLFLVTVLAVVAVGRPRRAWTAAKNALPSLAVAIAVFSVLSAFPLWVQFAGQQRIRGLIWDNRLYFNDPLSFVVPGRLQLLRAPGAEDIVSRFPGWTGEQGGYLGVGLVALLVVAAWNLRGRREFWCAIAVFMIMTVASLGEHLTSQAGTTSQPGAVPAWLHDFRLPWGYVRSLPLFEHILPSRLIAYSFLAAGLVVAIFLDQALRREGRLRRGAEVTLVALALLTLMPAAVPSTAQPVPSFFQSASLLRIPAGSTALLAPYAGWHVGDLYDLDADRAMVWQAAARMRFRMPEGYAFVPLQTGEATLAPPPSHLGPAMAAIRAGVRPTDLLGDPDRLRYLADLARWRVTTVIVGPMQNRPAMVDFMSSLFGQSPQSVGGVEIWWDPAVQLTHPPVLVRARLARGGPRVDVDGLRFLKPPAAPPRPPSPAKPGTRSRP
jgi:hypothetical protein